MYQILARLAASAAFKSLGSGDESSKEDTTNESSPKVILANTGMAGSAGKQKVATGGGTLPAPKAVKASGYSQNMPVDKLLETVVKYLSSINDTLKKGLEFDKRTYEAEKAATREQTIEEQPASTFTDLKDRLSGLADKAKDKMSMKNILLGLIGGLVITDLIADFLIDKEKISALKKAVDSLKEKISKIKNFFFGESENTSDATPVTDKSTTAPSAEPVQASPATPQSGSRSGKTIKSVVEGGRGYTTVIYSDGTQEKRTGTIAARANNPGNIEYGPFAKSYGAVGSSPSTNGPPVAVFPTAKQGFVAMDALLKGKYSQGPIGQTLQSWATDPNHTSKVFGIANVDPSKKYSDFTRDERVRLMNAIAQVEGYFAPGAAPASSGSKSVSSSQSSTPTATPEQSESSEKESGGFIRSIGRYIGDFGAALVGEGEVRNINSALQPKSDKTASIAKNSTALQAAIDFGVKESQQAANKLSPTQEALKLASPSNSISVIDPNYPGSESVMKYLSHYRLAK